MNEPTPAQQIAAALHDLSLKGSCFVAIDGFTGAGKSTLADSLAGLIDADVVRVDDLSAPGVLPWEWERFLTEVWQPIRNGVPATYRKHHWTLTEPGEMAKVRTGRPVILEGVKSSLLHLRPYLDFIVWVETGVDVRLERAQARGAQRFECWSTNWRPVEEQWALDENPNLAANLVVSGE